jgi:hypothetical protein
MPVDSVHLLMPKELEVKVEEMTERKEKPVLGTILEVLGTTLCMLQVVTCFTLTAIS